MLVRLLSITLCSVGISGCSAIKSSSGASESIAGLTYYLPKKDFVISVVVVKNQITTVTLDTTAAYPDLDKAYTLSFSSNWVGKNVINVGVSTSGLLTTAKATTTSGIAEALKNLGESLGTLHGKGLAAPAEVVACADGTHTFFLAPGQAPSKQPCGLSVKISKLSASVQNTNPTPAQGVTPGVGAQPSGEHVSGIYYRQAQPYLVEVTGSFNTASILFSPSESPVRLLPISPTFFASNEADFGFTDGMPTKYDQTTDGELIALFKIPADVLSAYFGAIGKVFDSFKSNDTKQIDVLQTSTQLELAKKKYEACLLAIQAQNNTLIEQLGCGK